VSEPQLNKEHFAFLDLARGIAVLAVFLFHTLDPVLHRHEVAWNDSWRQFPVSIADLLFTLASLGKYGVAVFFVISGFCIQLSYAKSKDKHWLPFFIRRSFRILPTYWFWLGVFACLTIVISWKAGLTPISFKNIGMHGLLLQNFRESIVYSINPSFWSLAVEAQLYLLFPVLVFSVSKWGWKPSLVFVFLIEIGFRFWASCDGIDLKPGEFFTLNYWWSWCIGAYVADRYVSGKKPLLKKIPLFVCLGLVLLTWAWEPTSHFLFTVVAFSTAVWLTHRLSSSKPTQNQSKASFLNFLSKPLTTLGLCSYSFYLVHQPILLMSARGFEDFQIHDITVRFAWFMFYGLVIFGVSLCSYRWIEMSSHRLGINLAIKH
jgi:peptidoglycan/LPS O-acetylase OafA/YrhL